MSKQDQNREKGESRTRAILANSFHIHSVTVDIEGRDFMVEIPYPTLNELQESKKRIKVLGIIQSKYFENNNEVKIAREYVEDLEGVKTDFFAILHTDDEDGSEHTYFFTSIEIKNKFYIRSEKNKEYYVFKLTKDRQYINNKDFSKRKINETIEEEMSRTEEYRNEQFIRKIEEKWIKPINQFENSNLELFNTIKDKHIVDKLYICLNTFNDFRNILAWRLVDKISFSNGINTRTYYYHFELRTNNKEIIDFFSNIEIDIDVKIKNKVFFKGVSNLQKKVDLIVKKLNQSNVLKIIPDGTRKSISIELRKTEICNCSLCQYERLNFFESDKVISNILEHSSWDNMSFAYSFFNLGKYDKAKETLNKVLTNTKSNKEFVTSFFCNYNLEITNRHLFDRDDINLYLELLKLDISYEKKNVLKFISERTLLNSYSNKIDEIYLKIKDYKQRRNNNSTLDLIDKQRIILIECFTFFRENKLFITDEFKILVEKHIESCIISYSMQTEYRSHLICFDDFIIKNIILHCDSYQLIINLQRNNIDSIKYSPNDNYFISAINNFFSNENAEYLFSEITYIDNKTKNTDLRRKSLNFFQNICILLTYIDITIEDKTINNIIHFIKKLDFTIDEVSYLAHPILGKPSLFSELFLLDLIKVIIDKEENKGYLITNCLYALNEKSFKLQDKKIIESITQFIFEDSRYKTLRAFSKLLTRDHLEGLKQQIIKKLNSDFKSNLYYEAVMSNCIDNPLVFVETYINEIKERLTKTNSHLFNNYSASTGINNYTNERFTEFIEILYTLNNDELYKNKTLIQLIEFHPYYNFLINIENYKDGNSFNIYWLLESNSDLILKKISKNLELKITINKLIKQSNDKNIHNIYFKYFVDKI